MALMEIGICSTEVLDLQKDLNKVFGSGKPPADGTYDEKTRDWVNAFQTRMGLRSTGKVDSSTLLALDNALVPRTKAIINGKETYVTKEGLAELRAKASADAVKATKPFVAMAKTAKGLRDAATLRDDNWFVSRVIETYAGADLPSKSLFDKAVKDAKSGKLTVSGRTSAPNPSKKHCGPFRNTATNSTTEATTSSARSRSCATVAW